MITHGSSTVIIFSAKASQQRTKKYKPLRLFAEAKLGKMFKCFGHQFATENEALRSRVKILEYFAGFNFPV